MKYLAIITILFLVGCGSSPAPITELTTQQKAEQSVRAYVLENTNDSATYQSLIFDSVMFDSAGNYYAISHGYRAANKMGGIQKYYSLFMLDTLFRVAKVL